MFFALSKTLFWPKPVGKKIAIINLSQLLQLLPSGLPTGVSTNMERKKPIKKNHIKEFGGRDAPEASQGQTRDVPGTPGTFGPDLCVNQY